MSTDYSTSVGLMSVDGLASGLDISGILEQISAARSQPVLSLQTQREELQDRLSLFQSLETYVLSLQTAALSAASADVYGAHSVSVSGADPTAAAPLVASADASAPTGTHSIVINKLAQAHRIRSGSMAASDEALGLSGDLLINGCAISLQAEDTLADLAAAINSAGGQVQATILHVADDDHRLVLTGLQTGADKALDLVDANSASLLEALGLVGSATSLKHAITQGAASDRMSSSVTGVGAALGLQTAPAGTIQINGTDVAVDLSVDSLQDLAQRINTTVAGVTATVETVTEDEATTYELRIVGDSETPAFSDSGNVLVTLGVLAKAVANEIQAAQDAEIILDQQTITRATNSLDDVLEGLSLQLVQADPARTLTLTVGANVEPAMGAVRQLVQRYNAVVDFIAENRSFDPDTGEGGAFLGSYDLVRLESDLRQAVTWPVQGLISATVLASQIGITTDQSDHLVLDETRLREALSDDPQAVRELFMLTAETTSSSVQYMSSTGATQASSASGYAVTVTQAAARARAESASLAAGIGVNETLTINSEWQVNLYAGMTLEQATQALNSTFAVAGLSLSAGVEGSRLTIQHGLYGSAYSFTITSSLDQGVGGTDLGGELAGQGATYTGLDVAGTIGGESATGDGRYLTGDEGNASTAGLRLLITAEAPGDLGVVRVAKGIAQRLADTISAVEQPTYGLFARLSDSVSDDIEAVDENIEREQARLDSYLDRLREQFVAMETALAKAQALSQYLSNQVTALLNLSSSSS